MPNSLDYYFYFLGDHAKIDNVLIIFKPYYNFDFS